MYRLRLSSVFLIAALLIALVRPNAGAQSSQTVNNGDNTTAIKFNSPGCNYTWINNTPSIGLPATGSGDISSFVAKNSGSSPVTATITATPTSIHYAYVANSGSGDVTVINTATNSVVTTIPVGVNPYEVLVAPDNKHVYVTNSGDNTVSIINTATNAVENTIPVGNVPVGVCLSMDGTKLYVTNSFSNNISIIELATNAVTGTITGFNSSDFPHDMCLSSDGSTMYVTNQGSASVAVINLSNNTIIKSISVGSNPETISSSLKGDLLYVSNYADKSISVIATLTNVVSATINLNDYCEQTVLSPDGSELYVADYAAYKILTISTATNTITSTIDLGGVPQQYHEPFGLDVSPDGKKLYAVDIEGAKLVVVDLPAGTIEAAIPVGSNPFSTGHFLAISTCINSPLTFTITVNATNTPLISASTATGVISSCAGTASSGTEIQQFTVSGKNLTGAVVATAPAGFEIATNQASGYKSTVTISPANGQINSIIYVRSSATAPVGTITGDVTLTSTNAQTQSVAVTGKVKGLAVATAPQNQTVSDGQNTTEVDFGSGTTETFNWTNDSPSIGLPSNGTGNIPSFKGTNTGTTPLVGKISVTPLANKYLYVSNSLDNTISVVDTKTNMIVNTIKTDAGPDEMVLSPDGLTLYVTCVYAGGIDIINTSNNTVSSITTGKQPEGIAISPDGSKVYVANNQANSISVINTVTKAVINTISLNINPLSVAVSPDGSKLFVGTQGYSSSQGPQNSVMIINASTYATLSVVKLSQYALTMASNTDGSILYAGADDTNITVIKTADGSILKTIDLKVDCLLLSNDGSTVFASVAGSSNISLISTATNSIIGTASISSGTDNNFMAESDDGNYLYVTNNFSNTIDVVDLTTNKFVTSIKAGQGASGVVYRASAYCDGVPTSFTITVNPASYPAITATSPAGAISSCQGNASVSPNIQSFLVSASGLKAAVTATAPAGFEVSLSSANGYSNNVSIPQSGGKINNVLVFVRSSSSAPVGQISGTVQLSSTGAPNVGVEVSGFISTVPVMNKPDDQQVNAGQNTTAVNFAGTANTFTWTNDTPSIGLAASGTGNIPSFAAVNKGSTAVKATITATPQIHKYIYVADTQKGTVTVLDPATIAIVAHINVGSSPEGVSVSPDGSRVYVANYNDGTVSVIDAATNTVIATVAVGNECYRVICSADSKFAYVSNYASNTVSVINTSSNTVSVTIPVSNGPKDMVFSPDQSKLYVANYFSSSVSVINTATNKVTMTLNCNVYPHGMAISADGNYLYVSQQNLAEVSVINTALNSIVAAIPVGKTPGAIVISADGSLAYVSNYDDGTVSIINTAVNQVIATPKAGTMPYGLSLSADGSILYVLDHQQGIISEINTSTLQLYGGLSVGAGADSFGNFITPGMSCPGVPVSFTITVNPAGTPNFNLTAVTGYISACQGNPSASPNIESFSVTGHNLGGNITATAPAGFEVSLSPNSGYANLVTLVQTGGVVSQTPVYIRSAASDPVGKIHGNIVLSESGSAAVNIPVTGVVNSVPTVSASPVSQEVTSGTFISPLNFTGTGNTFTWTNDQPSIGLAASGSGNIPSFPAINKGSSKVTATIAVTPQQIPYAYITNQQANTVSVINTINNTVVSTLKVGAFPTGTAISPDGTRVYVTNQRDNTISVINTITNSVTATLSLKNSSPTGIAVSPDGTKLYVVNLNSNSVSAIDAVSGNAIATYTVGGYPVGVSVNPDGTKIFVTNSSNSVSVIDLIKGNVSTINTANGPYGICTSVDGSLLYVTNSGSNSVSVISVSTSSIVSTIPVGNGPQGIAITPDGSTLYVANSNANTVSAISTTTYKVISTVNVGALPTGISTTSDGNFVYVTNQNSNSVSVINTTGNTVATNITVGAFPKSFGNFILPGSECPGNPTNFTIIVDPQGPPPTITAGDMTGRIIACSGTPSTGIGQVVVAGNNLTGNITATAPAGFEITLDTKTAYSNSVSIPQSGGTVTSAVVYVRSTAAAPVGNLYGNILLNSPGAVNVSVAATGIINIVPNAMPYPLSQEVMTGTSTGEIDFNGPGDIFTWTNDTPSIGLPANGSGAIPSFTAVNNTTGPVTATITITPQQVSYAYIPDRQNNQIWIINTQTNTVSSVIKDPEGPFGIAIQPDGKEIYDMSTNPTYEGIGIIDASTNTRPRGIGFGPDYGLEGAVVSPNGKILYMVASSKGQVISMDTDPAHIIFYTPYTVGGDPFAITTSPDGSALYVTNTTEKIVSVINTTNGNVSAINVPGIAYQTCITPDGRFLYITIPGNNSVEVYNTFTGSVVTTIPVKSKPEGITISPDGTTVYVTNNGSANVSVINTLTNSVTATVGVGSAPMAVSTTSDGQFVYVVDQGSNTVSVIRASDNTLTATIPVGSSPEVLGNFILPGSACPGQPSTVTITVDSKLMPSMTAGSVTGNIMACQGSPSADPYIGQFTVSGNNLKSAVTASAPAGFEVSINPTVGYESNTALSVSGGTLSNAVVYVRAAASGTAGNISGNIVLSSNSASSVNVPVSGVINALPSADKVASQTVTDGAMTTAVNFTGTGASFNWTNDKPSIGLPASGTGDIAPFAAVNNANSPVKATITVIPMPQATGLECEGVPTTFTITVQPSSGSVAAQNIVIPNTFTPNGDGVNDTWEIKSLENYPNCTVAIYNRWGEKLYSSIGYAIPWDGTHKGANLPVGTYYYIINLKKGVNPISGWVAIVK